MGKGSQEARYQKKKGGLRAPKPFASFAPQLHGCPIYGAGGASETGEKGGGNSGKPRTQSRRRRDKTVFATCNMRIPSFFSAGGEGGSIIEFDDAGGTGFLRV